MFAVFDSPSSMKPKRLRPGTTIDTMHQAPATTSDAGADVALSVVMPNYNHAEFLPASVAAILSQLRLPDEIVIVDDGSTDQSRAILERLASAEPRIRLIFNSKNSGAIHCINEGLLVSRGKYVCLMAADDVVYPDFFSRALEAFKLFPNVALFCAEADVQLMDEAERPKQMRPVIRPSNRLRAFNPAETRQLLRYNDNFILPIASMFRRDLLLSEGSFDLELGSLADGFLSRRLALKYGFCFAPVTVVRWQVRENSLSRTSSSNSKVVLSLLAKAESRISADPVFPQGYSAAFNRRLRFATCRIALTSRKPDWGFLQEIGPQRSIDQALFSVLRNLHGRWNVYLALLWLVLRYRPYSLLAMAGTFVRRQLDRNGFPTRRG
jgi:glycosyltransferase involved in cell wall biosynthesis